MTSTAWPASWLAIAVPTARRPLVLDLAATHRDPAQAAALAELGAEFKTSFQPGAFFDSRAGERRLLDHFKLGSLDGFGQFSRAELAALGAVLAYIELTQVGRMPALRPPRRADSSTSARARSMPAVTPAEDHRSPSRT